MADVFISYKSERRPAAWHLAKIFRANGFEPWYDYGLIPGEDFEPQLMAELERAAVVVVLWCRLSVASAWVCKEARAARAAGKYLPCWIEETPLPTEFSGADTIRLTEWDGAPRSHHLDRLLADAGRRIGREPSPKFAELRQLGEDWRNHGAPNLAQFALRAPIAARTEPPPAQILGPPPPGADAKTRDFWAKAQQGDADSIAAIGVRYYMATGGLPQDDHEAARLSRLAADQGNALGQASLGFFYATGSGGLEKDDHEAARLYRLAADQGNAGGQNNLGFFYQNGRGGLEKDDCEAARLYRLAADQGDAAGQSNLGVFYETGRGGLEQDDREAARLYRLAADQGNAGGQYNLGDCYERGVGGCARDLGEARRLYTLAAEQGDESAKSALRRLGRG